MLPCIIAFHTKYKLHLVIYQLYRTGLYYLGLLRWWFSLRPMELSIVILLFPIYHISEVLLCFGDNKIWFDLIYIYTYRIQALKWPLCRDGLSPPLRSSSHTSRDPGVCPQSLATHRSVKSPPPPLMHTSVRSCRHFDCNWPRFCLYFFSGALIWLNYTTH